MVDVSELLTGTFPLLPDPGSDDDPSIDGLVRNLGEEYDEGVVQSKVTNLETDHPNQVTVASTQCDVHFPTTDGSRTTVLQETSPDPIQVTENPRMAGNSGLGAPNVAQKRCRCN
jgi:hypothetical protein